MRKYSDPKPVPCMGRHGRVGRDGCFNVVEAAKRGIPKPEIVARLDEGRL